MSSRGCLKARSSTSIWIGPLAPAFIALIHRHVHLFAVQDADVMTVEPSCRDPNDNQFLALAVAAEADVIVSSDKDLLVLNPWRGIPIVTPAEFLSNARVSREAEE
jgi:predicted nucleic acid-binding protein